MEAIEWTIYFGLNDKNGVNVGHLWEAFESVYVASKLDAYTVEDAKGVWKKQGEKSKKITCILEQENGWIKDIAIAWRITANQECVLVSHKPIRYDFF